MPKPCGVFWIKGEIFPVILVCCEYMNKVKRNYSSWDISVEEFPYDGSVEEQLKFLLGYAILAPSSHNAQPWKFSIRGNLVIVYGEESRRLNISDPDQRLEHVSFGCAIEFFIIAAEYFGFLVDVEYLPEEERGAVARLEVTGENKSKSFDENHLIHSITSRHSNRHDFEEREVSDSVLENLINIKNSNVNVHVMSEEEKKNKYASTVMKSRHLTFEDEAFRHEMAKHKKNNFTKACVGIPGFTMGFNALKSLIVPTLIKKMNVIKLSYKKDEAQFGRFSSAHIVLTTSEDTKVAWLESGRILARILLSAQQSGVSASINASPSGEDIHCDQVRELLDTEEFVQISCRIGYTTKKMKHSPRLPVEDVLS